MENRFKDFPCLYFLDKRVDKRNNVQFYAMLASMFGQTPKQAAQTSELFAHASGKLFNGVGFSEDEIMHDAGTAFTKPYKDCRGFYRRKVYADAGLKDNCCLICPYSHSYANNGLDYERQVLRLIIEHHDWIETVGCSTGDFRSYLALSCTNDISEYPIIPFNALLFEYLMQNMVVEIETVVTFMRDALVRKNHIIPETVLRPFIVLQLDIINRTTLLSGNDISSLFFALGSLRESSYAPPQLVHLASSNNRTGTRKRNESISNKVNNLVQLFQDFENIEFIDKNNNPPKNSDSVEKLLQALGDETEAPKATEDSIEKAKDENADDLDRLLEFLSSPEIGTPAEVSNSITRSVNKDVVSRCESDILLTGSVEKSHTSIQEYITLVAENEPYSSGISDMNVGKEDTCFLCHHPIPEEGVFENEWMQSIYMHCSSCEKAYIMEEKKPVFSSPVLHQTKAGCAFSSGVDSSCIYSSVPVHLSEEFFENIIDCSEFIGNLKNLVLFVEASADADQLSVESVQYHGIEGLLFYISGTYYFITGGYTTNAALKRLFSDASKHSFFSMNPILVHVKLSHFGIHRAKVESLAVLYSVFTGIEFLLPPALFFRLDYSIDMYRSIMPQYASFFSGVKLTDTEQERYDRLKKLEWGLASSVDISFISFGKNRSVHGSNALNYRFSLFESERICREGMLLIVSLAEESALPPKNAKVYWEDVVGRLSSSSLSCMKYSFLLGLGEGVSYYTYFEEDAFYDSLMASARSAYKKMYKKEVHLNVVKEQFITNE